VWTKRRNYVKFNAAYLCHTERNGLRRGIWCGIAIFRMLALSLLSPVLFFLYTFPCSFPRLEEYTLWFPGVGVGMQKSYDVRRGTGSGAEDFDAGTGAGFWGWHRGRKSYRFGGAGKWVRALELAIRAG
jgi:hypothetical protein